MEDKARLDWFIDRAITIINKNGAEYGKERKTGSQ